MLASFTLHANSSCPTPEKVKGEYKNFKNKKNVLVVDGFIESDLKLRHYCLFTRYTDDGVLLARLYNGKSQKFYEVSNFYTALDSPDGSYTVVASGTSPGKITKLSLFNAAGEVPFDHDFDFSYDSFLFRVVFSADNRFLNFYQIEELSISYNSLNLLTGELHLNIMGGDAYSQALNSDPNTYGSHFTHFIPVSDVEFTSLTTNNYLAYYRNGNSIWTTALQGEQGDSRVLVVGQKYVVVLNHEFGIDLYRKSDGKAYTVIKRIVPHEHAALGGIKSARLVGTNLVYLSLFYYEHLEDSNEIQTKLLIDLNNHKIRKLN